MHYAYVRSQPVPTCPLCRATMLLRRPKPGEEWRPFWSCSRYPACRGTRSTELKDSLMPWDDTTVWKSIRIYGPT